MNWNQQEQSLFLERVNEYWPAKGKQTHTLQLYVEELRNFPMSIVLQALREIKVSEDFPRIPSPNKVKTKVRELSPESTTGWESALYRLRELSERRAIWKSPKGITCRIHQECLELMYTDPKKFIPYGMLNIDDLSKIISEAQIPYNAEGDISWKDYVETTDWKSLIAKMEYEGKDTSWLKKMIPRWQSGTTIPASIQIKDLDHIPPPITEEPPF